MNFNLRMLNCWIGLCRGVPPLPKDIAEAGYVDKAIERKFKTGKGAECKPELVIASRKQGHSILWEWKDGRTIDLGQLRRYTTATPDDLVERVYLARDECKSHDAVLLVKGEHGENTVSLLDRESMSFTVVGAYPARFKTIRGGFSCVSFAKTLLDFPCEWELAPVSFVPFDRDSSVTEVAPHVLTLILQRLLRRDSLIRSIDLCGEVCPLFSAMSSDARTDVETKISEVFAAAAEHEFAPYLEFKKQSHGSSQLTIVTNPFQIGDNKRSKAFKRMRRLQGEFLEALTLGHRPPPEPNLFD